MGKSLGEKIRQSREGMGYSKSIFSKKIGISSYELNTIEAGLTQPSSGQILIMEYVLQTELA